MAKKRAKKKTAHRVSKRQATPTRLNRSVRSDGLVLQVGTRDTDPRDALRIARRIVKDELAGEWVVSPMGRESRQVSVRKRASEKNPSPPQAFELAYKLRRHRDVEDCEPSLLLPVELGEAPTRFGAVSSDTIFGGHLPCSVSHRWALRMCRVAEAWDVPSRFGKSKGEGIRIAHPDTGYTFHRELDHDRVRVDLGFDFEDGDPNPFDTLDGLSGGHGTSTGSVIMSGEGAGASITGVAPLSELVPLRVTTSVVLLSGGKLAESIWYAADEGHHVISISLGGVFISRFLTEAVRNATERGIIIVAAAGNVVPFVVRPASLDEVIAVAACNCERDEWSLSASGRAVDITAPGESVWRALADPSELTIERSSGTSYSTAMTAGAAALWLAHHGRQRLIDRYGLSNVPSVFKELLLRHGFDRPPGWDTRNFGPGILNAKKLLLAPLPRTVAAGGMSALRAEDSPRSESQLDMLLNLFRGGDTSSVRLNLMQMLGVEECDLETCLRDVSEEIAYQAVMDSDFHKRLGSKHSKKRTAADLCPTKMSRTLRRMTTRS